MVIKNICKIRLIWKSQKALKIPIFGIYQSLIYPRKYSVTINCIIDVATHSLNSQAAKKHMFLKVMSTKGSHLNPFFFVHNHRYCKSTKFGVLFNLADLALGQKLNRIIEGKTSIITQKVVNPPNFIAVKISWFTVSPSEKLGSISFQISLFLKW